MARFVLLVVVFFFVTQSVNGRPKNHREMEDDNEHVLRDKLGTALQQPTGFAMISILESCPKLHEKICADSPSSEALDCNNTSPITGQASQGTTQPSESFGWLVSLIQRALNESTREGMVSVMGSSQKLRCLVCHSHSTPSPTGNAQPETTTPSEKSTTKTTHAPTEPGMSMNFVDMNFRDDFMSFPNRERRSVENGAKPVGAERKTKRLKTITARKALLHLISKEQIKDETVEKVMSEEEAVNTKWEKEKRGNEFHYTTVFPANDNTYTTASPTLPPVTSFVQVDEQFDESMLIHPGIPGYVSPWIDEAVPKIPEEVQNVKLDESDIADVMPREVDDGSAEVDAVPIFDDRSKHRKDTDKSEILGYSQDDKSAPQSSQIAEAADESESEESKTNVDGNIEDVTGNTKLNYKTEVEYEDDDEPKRLPVKSVNKIDSSSRQEVEAKEQLVISDIMDTK